MLWDVKAFILSLSTKLSPGTPFTFWSSGPPRSKYSVLNILFHPVRWRFEQNNISFLHGYLGRNFTHRQTPIWNCSAYSSLYWGSFFLPSPSLPSSSFPSPSLPSPFPSSLPLSVILVLTFRITLTNTQDTR